MIVQCPRCGETITVNGLGRKRLDIPLKNILDMVYVRQNVLMATNDLGCSPAYIFKVLKDNGLKLKDAYRQPAPGYHTGEV